MTVFRKIDSRMSVDLAIPFGTARSSKGRACEINYNAGPDFINAFLDRINISQIEMQKIPARLSSGRTDNLISSLSQLRTEIPPCEAIKCCYQNSFRHRNFLAFAQSGNRTGEHTRIVNAPISIVFEE